MMSEYSFVLVLIVGISLVLVGLFLANGLNNEREQSIRAKVEELQNSTIEMSPKEFLRMRKASPGGRGHRSYASKYDFSGVYVLHNITKDLYYVGQGKNIMNRVNTHFTGRGNGDVYADYKYGDVFTIKMIALDRSGFSTLNELERYTISYYDAYHKGYNKTRGNW